MLDKLYIKFLVFIGLRSKCCQAEIYDWSDTRAYCRGCGEKVD